MSRRFGPDHYAGMSSVAYRKEQPMADDGRLRRQVTAIVRRMSQKST